MTTDPSGSGSVGRPLSPGWYRIKGSVNVEGSCLPPALRLIPIPAAGGTPSHAHWVGVDGRGQVDDVLVMPHPADRLAVEIEDGSCAQGASLAVVEVSRGEALRKLLSGAGDGRWLATALVALDFLARAMTSGPRAAADELVARRQARVHRRLEHALLADAPVSVRIEGGRFRPAALEIPAWPLSAESSVWRVRAKVHGRPLGPGWYRLTGAARPGVRWRLAKEAELDAAAGPWQSLPPADAQGRVRGLVFLEGDCDWLQLDGGGHAPEQPVLRAVPGWRAAVALLRALPAGPARSAAIRRTWARSRRGGAALAALDLAARHWSRFPAAIALRMARARGLSLRLVHGVWPWQTRRITMTAAQQLDPEAGGDAWYASGSDPKFIATTQAFGAPVRAGWYRVQARMQVLEGQLVGPCLYPDYGRGESEGAIVPLGEPGADGRIDQLVVFRQAVHAIRFDPTMQRARFLTDPLRLQRLGRARAFAYMLGRLGGHGARERAGRVRRALGDFLRQALGSGVSAATRELYRGYQETGVRSQVSYSTWVQRFDTFSSLDLDAMGRRAASLANGPKVSLLVPVYDTPEPWLRRCLDSVIAQAYPNWELCIADDASPAPHVARVLAEYAARDPRIRLVRRERNGHISLASNSALALCTGDYVGLLDHDDELRPHALLEVAEALARRPGLKLIYSDEDKIDEKGRRFDPYFKPDWDPDLLRSQNYLCHFTVIEAALVRAVGGFRAGYEGSQDHDLFLRCTERLSSGQIHHIPHVLYHWRAIAGSTALVRDAKDYAADAGARAVADHLVRHGADASLEPLPHGHFRVRWGLGPTPPKVSLVIPTRDRLPLLRTCVESVLARTDYPRFEVVVVDNGSTEPETLDYLATLSAEGRAKVLRYDRAFNFSAINNWAIAQCDGEVVGLLNNDLEVISPGWLREMAGHALRADVGAVGAMLYYPDDRIQHAGVVLGVGGIANHAYAGLPRGTPGHGARAKVAQSLSAVTAACMVVRRELFERVGGLDEQFEVAFNDIDFCLRLRAAGFRNVWTPFAELYHHESASRGAEDTPDKAARFRGEVERMEARWGESLYWDPAYNPNLTLFATDFGYAFPPRVEAPSRTART